MDFWGDTTFLHHIRTAVQDKNKTNSPKSFVHRWPVSRFFFKFRSPLSTVRESSPFNNHPLVLYHHRPRNLIDLKQCFLITKAKRNPVKTIT